MKKSLISLMAIIMSFLQTSVSNVKADVSILYVKPDTTGNCSTWDQACDLDIALEIAVYGDEIWVASGVYVPDTSSYSEPRYASFYLKNGVSIYGGFLGTEITRDERDFKNNLTYLSGDIGIAGDIIDNLYHVVQALDVGVDTIFDGFIIENGKAEGWSHHQGGGLYINNSQLLLRNLIIKNNEASSGGGVFSYASSPTFENLIVDSNSAMYGGGIYVEGGQPIIRSVLFINNYGESEGGGLLIDSSDSIISDSKFIKNNSTFGAGGGIFVDDNYLNIVSMRNLVLLGNSALAGGGIYAKTSDYRIENSLIGNNIAEYGGGIYNFVGDMEAINVTISGNYAHVDGGALVERGGFDRIFNSIVSANEAGNSYPQIQNIADYNTVSFSFSLIEDGCPEFCNCTNLITGSALFNDPDGPDDIPGNEDDDFRLSITSPAIDAGNNDFLPTEITTDLNGFSRFIDVVSIPDTGIGSGPIVDLGAFEAPYHILHVNLNAMGNNTGQNWNDAFFHPQEAFNYAVGGVQIWIAAGKYTPGLNREDAFSLPEGAKIYGGFLGNETDLQDRNWELNKSVFDGDIGIIGNVDDNAFHVIVNRNDNVLIDGFTIINGNANGSETQSMGGGILNISGNISIINTTLMSNNANSGGGIYVIDGNPEFISSFILGNSANSGGALFLEAGQSSITNSVVSGNQADISGGAVYTNSSFISINSSFGLNTAVDGAFVYATENANVSILNSAIWDNYSPTANHFYNNGLTNIAYSIIQGGCPTNSYCESIIDKNPNFVDPDGLDNMAGTTDDNYYLGKKSIAIDAGNNNLLPNDLFDLDNDEKITELISLDLLRRPRVMDVMNIPDTGLGNPAVVDIGAFEYQGKPAKNL